MIYKFGEFEVDDQLFQLRRGHQLVPLERRVFDLLAYLVLQRHRVITKAELFECLWEGRKVSEGSLTVAIAAARKALGDDPASPTMIGTYHRRGYRFLAAVSEFHSSSFSGTYSPRVHGETRKFVGRQGEIAHLRSCLESSGEGRCQVLLISGEPGIGKSRLAEEFAQLASKLHATVLTARCQEADGAPPFWPWIQILRELVGRNGLRSDLPEAVRVELSRLVPELAASTPDSRVGEQDPTRARFRLFDAVSSVIRDTTLIGLTVLIVDDLHRADKPSLLLLEFIVRHLKASRILIVLTDRDIETQRSALHRESIGRILRENGARVVLLSGLTEDETEEFICSSGVADAGRSQAGTLRDLTGGNPFFLTQILPLVADPSKAGNSTVTPLRALPGTVRDAIARHLDGLAEPTVAILKAASVIGREFSDHVLRLATRQLAGTADALDEACRARVIALHPSIKGVYRFSHALVRDALYEGLASGARCSLHWRVGEAIEATTGDNNTGQVLEVAHHFYRGVLRENGPRALDACAAAGAFASQRLAYEEAVLQYGRATELVLVCREDDHELHCDLRLALGSEQARAGERSGSQSTFGIASKIARLLNDPDRFARAALGSFPGFFAVEAGSPDAFAIRLLKEALELVGDSNAYLRALLLARLAMALAWSDEGDGRESLSQEAFKLAIAIDDPTLVLQVLLARWFAEWEPSRFEERWRIAEELVERAEGIGDPETLLLCRLFWVTCLLERGEKAMFLRQLAVFEDAAEVLNQREALWYAALLRSACALHEGRLADAEALSLRFAEIGEMVGDANVFHSRMAHKTILAWEMGNLRDLVANASKGCEKYPGVIGWRAAYTWSLGQAGMLDACRQEFEILARRDFQDIPRRMDWPLTMAFLADVAVLLNAKEAASILYRLLEPLRGRNIVVGLCVANWGCASRFLGSLARSMGLEALAAEHFLEAIQIDDHSGARAWAARDRYEYARLARASSERESRVRGELMLSQAAQTCSELGLSELARRIESLGEDRVL